MPATARKIATNREYTAMATEQVDVIRERLDEIYKSLPVTAPVTRRSSQKGRDVMQPNPHPHQAQSNSSIAFDALKLSVAELGATSGKSLDTMIQFDLKLVENTYSGVIDLEPHKHGKDRDDAAVLAEVYVKAHEGAVIFDVKARNRSKTISNARKMIKLGLMQNFGAGQPLQNINDLINIRQNLRKTPSMAGKLQDAHNMLMQYATAQLKSTSLITGPDLRDFAFKKDPEQRTPEQVLEAIRKTARNLMAGKISNCPDADTSDDVKDIIAKCTKRLTAIAKARGAANPGAALTASATNTP